MSSPGTLNGYALNGGPLDGGGNSSSAVSSGTLKEEVVRAIEMHATLAVLLGSRVYPQKIPQTAALPALAYRLVSNVHTMHLTGSSGLKWTRLRFLVRSHIHSEIEAALEAMRDRFEGAPYTLGPLRILFCLLENESDSYDDPLPGSDLGTHSKSFDLRFKLRESIPTHTP